MSNKLARLVEKILQVVVDKVSLAEPKAKPTGKTAIDFDISNIE